ncbi:MAG: hypothetical protein HC831_28495 [Chloroflexia bacterium]|nr:hypothetical protein [Chloroflexia bacterium]
MWCYCICNDLSFGKISGAHINPAVSVGLWLTGKLESHCLKSYIFAQLTGAVIASLLIAFIFSSDQNLGATLPSAGIIQSFLFEFLPRLFWFSLS